jgi:hypothetical protein
MRGRHAVARDLTGRGVDPLGGDLALDADQVPLRSSQGASSSSTVRTPARTAPRLSSRGPYLSARTDRDGHCTCDLRQCERGAKRAGIVGRGVVEELPDAAGGLALERVQGFHAVLALASFAGHVAAAKDPGGPC